MATDTMKKKNTTASANSLFKELGFFVKQIKRFWDEMTLTSFQPFILTESL
jgi:hypothetical protein